MLLCPDLYLKTKGEFKGLRLLAMNGIGLWLTFTTLFLLRNANIWSQVQPLASFKTFFQNETALGWTRLSARWGLLEWATSFQLRAEGQSRICGADRQGSKIKSFFQMAIAWRSDHPIGFLQFICILSSMLAKDKNPKWKRLITGLLTLITSKRKCRQNCSHAHSAGSALDDSLLVPSS